MPNASVTRVYIYFRAGTELEIAVKRPYLQVLQQNHI